MNKVYWIWLSQIPYVGPVLQKRLLQTFHTPEAVYHASPSELCAVQQIGKRAADAILSHRSLEKAKRIQDRIERTSIQLLAIDSPLYPERTKKCAQSPIVLYVLGQLHEVQEAVSIVGTRRCTDYGKRTAMDLSAQLASRHIPVISGLAKGIDGYAHTACLRGKGYTIAFVAGGVDICYPEEHRILYEEIIQKGAVISQYPPGIQPHPKRFLQRNALISAWSTHVVIIEAGWKSGALSTAHFAKQQKHKLFAVPHPIGELSGEGTNRLIAEGVPPYLDLASLGLQKNEKKVDTPKENSKILTLLENSPLPAAVLANQLNMAQDKLTEELFFLEMAGKVFTRGGMVMKS